MPTGPHGPMPEHMRGTMEHAFMVAKASGYSGDWYRWKREVWETSPMNPFVAKGERQAASVYLGPS